MSIGTCKLTVFFEKPFWVGVFERTEDGKLSVSKVTFGTEPKEYEVNEFVVKHYDKVIVLVRQWKLDYKRKKREIRRSFSAKFISRCLRMVLERSPRSFKIAAGTKKKQQKANSKE